MIAYIKGKILKKNLNSVIINNNDIGYEVHVPISSLYKFNPGDEIELVTYLHVREDIMQLYGFLSWEVREIFLLLINVSGIGPKGALSILSHISIDQLRTAISNEDINLLTKLPGLGKKTAQRLVVELKDKMEFKSDYVGLVSPQESTDDNEIVLALISLGYQHADVRKIIPGLYQENPGATEGELIKKALQILAKL
ncbi:MAG: Holliday junction branch migration protein RuvA [Bacillota bacterium]